MNGANIIKLIPDKSSFSGRINECKRWLCTENSINGLTHILIKPIRNNYNDNLSAENYIQGFCGTKKLFHTSVWYIWPNYRRIKYGDWPGLGDLVFEYRDEAVYLHLLHGISNSIEYRESRIKKYVKKLLKLVTND